VTSKEKAIPINALRKSLITLDFINPIAILSTMLKFAFNEAKALAALAFVANEQPGLTTLFVSKILFFAEKWHINRYGRPIIADTYIAMPRGPVPSTIKNFIDEKWDWVDRPEGFDDAIKIGHDQYLKHVWPGAKGPNMGLLSQTDVECLQEAMAFCRGKSATELSDLTHFEKSWRNAAANAPMLYEDFVDDDNVNRDEILQEMRATAVSGVL
jgi:uncharacterized phage-associated protein